MKYSILSQLHPDYNHEDIERKHLLYEGGEHIIEEAHHFIPKNQGEHPDAYKARLSCSSYVNYMASIIDYFAANLFSKELSVLPAADAADPSTPGGELPEESFYREFSEDADLRGNDFAHEMKCVFRQGMISGHGFLGIDFPRTDIVPETREQEEALGLDRAYTYHINERSVINWDVDELGKYNWVVLRKEFPVQTSPYEERLMKKIQFKVWTKVDGVVSWQLYELTVKIQGEPKPKDEFPLVDSGITSFKQIPILCFKPTKGLWIGNKIGTLVADHFRMRSSLFYAQNRSMYAMPYYKQGAEYDSSGDMSVIAEDVSRGSKAARTFASRGFAVIGPTDELGFAEPTGSAYELINQELKEHVDEIYRTVSQMAQSVTATASGSARSGTSKMQDNHSMEMLLGEYGQLIRQFAQEVYDCISEARNEDIVWNVHGLSNYEIIDKTQLLAEAVAFSENMVNIPSMTFKKVHYNKLAQAFTPNISPELQLTIENEISDWCDSNETDIMEVAAPLHAEDVAMAQAKASKPPPGAAKPKAKKK